MPSIMIVAHTTNADEAAVFLAERLTTLQLDDAHYAAQLFERLKWAGEDAEHAERETAPPTPPDRASPSFVDPGRDRPGGSRESTGLDALIRAERVARRRTRGVPAGGPRPPPTPAFLGRSPGDTVGAG